MFLLFKKKARIDDVALGLLALASTAEKQRAQDITSFEEFVAGRQEKLSVERFLNELFFLRIMAIEYAIERALKNRSLAVALLDAFAGHLRRIIELQDPTRESLDALRTRLTVYSQALNTPTPKDRWGGPFWNVGKAFARLCGEDEPDIALVGHGSIAFAGTVKAVSEALGSFKIVE